jgi:hypothetical protein
MAASGVSESVAYVFVGQCTQLLSEQADLPVCRQSTYQAPVRCFWCSQQRCWLGTCACEGLQVLNPCFEFAEA